jgi:hypothetical protein
MPDGENPRTYQITASGTPTSFGATGLPSGFSINTSTGLISGTPAIGGVFNVTVSAANVAGTATAVVVFTILGIPVVTSATTALGGVGSAFSYQITAFGSPTSFGASGLPAGLSVNTSTGLLCYLRGRPCGSGLWQLLFLQLSRRC